MESEVTKPVRGGVHTGCVLSLVRGSPVLSVAGGGGVSPRTVWKLHAKAEKTVIVVTVIARRNCEGVFWISFLVASSLMLVHIYSSTSGGFGTQAKRMLCCVALLRFRCVVCHAATSSQCVGIFAFQFSSLLYPRCHISLRHMHLCHTSFPALSVPWGRCICGVEGFPGGAVQWCFQASAVPAQSQLCSMCREESSTQNVAFP